MILESMAIIYLSCSYSIVDLQTTYELEKRLYIIGHRPMCISVLEYIVYILVESSLLSFSYES